VSTAIYRTWDGRIESGVFTKSQCQAWARTVLPLVQHGTTRAKTSLTTGEALLFAAKIDERGGMRLTDEHTAQGLAWLDRYASKRLPTIPSDWRERFSHFLYMGDGQDYGRSSDWRQYVPVWRIVLTDGEQWDYYALAWQTGYDDDEAWKVTA
jgi:hypothetical protein